MPFWVNCAKSRRESILTTKRKRTRTVSAALNLSCHEVYTTRTGCMRDQITIDCVTHHKSYALNTAANDTHLFDPILELGEFPSPIIGPLG